MKPGEIVQIYTNPLTLEKPEGHARLITQTDSPVVELEKWTVEFMDLPGNYFTRYIKPTT
jgi:hypothetical protein